MGYSMALCGHIVGGRLPWFAAPGGRWLVRLRTGDVTEQLDLWFLSVTLARAGAFIVVWKSLSIVPSLLYIFAILFFVRRAFPAWSRPSARC